MPATMSIKHITEHSSLADILANLNDRCRADMPIDEVSEWLSADLAAYRDGLGEAVAVSASDLRDLAVEDAEECGLCSTRLFRGHGVEVASGVGPSRRYCDTDHARRAGVLDRDED